MRPGAVIVSDRGTAAARFLLVGILVVIAFSALGGGYDGMTGAKGIPLAWLEGTLFHSHFIPSLTLFVYVGALCLLAAISIVARVRIQLALASAAGITLIGWTIVQVALIGLVSILQPIVVGLGLAVLALSAYLRAD